MKEKGAVLRGGISTSAKATISAAERGVGGGGYRTQFGTGDHHVPLVVVGGTPYEMGWHLGHLLAPDIQAFIPRVTAGFRERFGISPEQVASAWSRISAYGDDRFEQELLGVSDGSGVPLVLLQQAHTFPMLLPYSCSSVAAWGKATADGHLYQTRNLDWDLEAGAHEFAVVVVYLPAKGLPHVIPTFAGFIGAHCGMNRAGIVLAEMGDSPKREMPYNLLAPHFTVWFRSLLYDADSLSQALEMFKAIPMTKRYHFVFGDGRSAKRAVKISAQSPEPKGKRLRIWSDNDPNDELAPRVLPDVVYQDEERGAFPLLQRGYGHLDPPAMIAICNAIPIKGSNVVDTVFDGTGMRLWVSYAGKGKEAYQRPYSELDLARLDGDGDGRPDMEEGGGDADGDGRPDFLDP